ncbi:hypothetical protein RHS01_04252 [Rhizoctonia solani]|uniref:Uncharacterized protein n=1 Tax=Rhizoctonia solani TaxID=456999 RepID=A0A8H7M5L5_9AGAM|nr:hypothetical protein RHS01_04252 [Rhizoctonia solani]
MEPEPTLRILLNAINTLSLQVGSLQDQVKSQGKTIQQLLAVCKETNNLARAKDQGQAKLGPAAGPSTPPDQQGAKPTLLKQLGLGDKDLETPSKQSEVQLDTIQRKKKSQGKKSKRSLAEHLGV